jgi:hypothetical protein
MHIHQSDLSKFIFFPFILAILLPFYSCHKYRELVRCGRYFHALLTNVLCMYAASLVLLPKGVRQKEYQPPTAAYHTTQQLAGRQAKCSTFLYLRELQLDAS